MTCDLFSPPGLARRHAANWDIVTQSLRRPLSGDRGGASALGAAYRNRTDDLFITSESLCRLS